MKVITLVPVKNEEWILEFSLKNFELFSDEIIILDDHSTDESRHIAERFKKITLLSYSDNEMPVDMSKRRTLLLEEGRKRGGTHFVMLDADETLSQTVACGVREKIKPMKPGEVLLLPWLFVRRQGETLLFDKSQRENYKDFIFCDDGISTFTPRRLSEDRTPGSHMLLRYLPCEEGYVLHWQHLPERRNEYKQAWYRCNELIEGGKTARRINAIYAFTKESGIKNAEIVRDPFFEENKTTIRTDAGYEWYRDAIMAMFEERGVIFFEALDIWHIQELLAYFITTTGRKPQPKFYPAFLLWLRAIKNSLKKKL